MADPYEAAKQSVGTPVCEDSDAAAMFRLVLIKAQNIVKKLFAYYMEYPDELPAEFTMSLPPYDPFVRRVCDNITGFIDRYAFKKFKELFVDPLDKLLPKDLDV